MFIGIWKWQCPLLSKTVYQSFFYQEKCAISIHFAQKPKSLAKGHTIIKFEVVNNNFLINVAIITADCTAICIYIPSSIIKDWPTKG